MAPDLAVEAAASPTCSTDATHMASQRIGLLLVAASGPGVLHQLTGVIAR
jgi:hypothetical protein